VSDFEYDFFVIGAGSGGVRAARTAAAMGRKVGVAEERFLGGTCVNVGCVPKKLFVHASHFSKEVEHAAEFGWSTTTPTLDWPTLRDNKTREIERLNGIYRNLIKNSGADLFEARAVVTGPNSVRVGDREITAEHILVATGGWPFVPEFPGSEHVVTSNEMFFLEELPTDALIVGGGYIAVEFAGILNGLGVNTVLSYRGPLFLRSFDADIREVLHEEMLGQGVDLRFDTQVERIEKTADGRLDVYFKDGEVMQTGLVMYATGRRPNTHGLGLESAGVELTERGIVKVNEFYQTSVPSIHALGDIIGTPELTPLATAQAMALVSTLFKGEPRSVSVENIPTAVFSQPPIGTVGLTEEQARAQGHRLKIFQTRFRPLKNTLGSSPERVFMKMVVDAESDRVLGVHMVGDDAGEIIQGIAVAMIAGATKADFDATIGIHPTAAEEFVTMREPVHSD